MALKTRSFVATARAPDLPAAIAALDAEVTQYLATLDAVDVADVKTAVSPSADAEGVGRVTYVVTVIYLEA